MTKLISVVTGKLIRQAAKIRIQLPTFNHHSSQPKDAGVLDVEQELHHVSFRHHIILAFTAQPAFASSLRKRTRL
jgi:hypothetical protein